MCGAAFFSGIFPSGRATKLRHQAGKKVGLCVVVRFAMKWTMNILIFLLLLGVVAVMFTSFSPTPSSAG